MNEDSNLLELRVAFDSWAKSASKGPTLTWLDNDRFEAFAAGYRAQRQAVPQGWKPIETAPSDVCVLLYTPQLHETNPERIEARVYHDSRAGSRHAWATHWMHLPTAPAALSGDDFARLVALSASSTPPAIKPVAMIESADAFAQAPCGALTDAQYLREIAKRYEGTLIPEFNAHRDRLHKIADFVERAQLLEPEGPAQDTECAPFLKDGETPAQCIKRNRDDALAAIRLYYNDAKRYEKLRAIWLDRDGGTFATMEMCLAETADEFDAALDAVTTADVHAQDTDGGKEDQRG